MVRLVRCRHRRRLTAQPQYMFASGRSPRVQDSFTPPLTISAHSSSEGRHHARQKRDAKRDAKRRRRNRCKRPRRPRQSAFCWRTHGGQRRGAGRKPAGRRAGVPHRSRGEVLPTTPVHVGLKVAADISNLRHPDLFGPLREAIYAGSDRLGMRIIHFSVIEDHLHFIVEAEGVEALARGMQGLAVRLARRINKVLGRRGKVFTIATSPGCSARPRRCAFAFLMCSKTNFATTGSEASCTGHGGWTTARPGSASPAGRGSR